MTRLSRSLGLATFSLAVMSGVSTLRAQQTPAPQPTSSGSVPDQATITEDYQAIESPAATRLPAAPVPAPSPTPVSNNGDSPASSPNLDQSWRNFQTPHRISRTSPNSYTYGYGAYPGGDQTWGYRNPGGVGRVTEYYPPDDQFQNGGPHNYIPQFDQGPYATTRQAQFQAEALGISKYNAIQGHIDRYGAPRFGFGFGFGGLGMFPY